MLGFAGAAAGSPKDRTLGFCSQRANFFRRRIIVLLVLETLFYIILGSLVTVLRNYSEFDRGRITQLEKKMSKISCFHLAERPFCQQLSVIFPHEMPWLNVKQNNSKQNSLRV